MSESVYVSLDCYYKSRLAPTDTAALFHSAWEELPELQLQAQDTFVTNATAYAEQHDRVEILAYLHKGNVVELVGGLGFTWGVDGHFGPCAWPLFTFVLEGARGTNAGFKLQREYIKRVKAGNLPAFIKTARTGPGVYTHTLRRTQWGQ